MWTMMHDELASVQIFDVTLVLKGHKPIHMGIFVHLHSPAASQYKDTSK
jgi:hypothetical protein